MVVRRHGPSRRICIVAGHDDLPEVTALLAGLPADSYGQVFLACAPGEAPVTLTSPPRVMVSWLLAAADNIQSIGDGRISAAMTGWMAEWADAAPEERPTLWVGPSVREEILEMDLCRLDLADSTFSTPCYDSSVVPVTPGADPL